MQDLISIIVPTYNRAHLIKKTLDSIKNQSYPNWECIVVDDGSTDNTDEILDIYIKADNRFKFHRRPEAKDKGANPCRNYGLELSKGEYINWFDSDDIMHKDKLKIQVTNLKNSDAPYCICQSKVFDLESNKNLGLRSSEISSTNRFEDYVLQKIVWLTTAPLWKRQFLEENNLCFDESLHQSQEYDFHVRALIVNSDYIAIDKPLVTIVRHEDSISHAFLKSENKIESNLKVKGEILKNYSSNLSQKAKIKLYETETLMYKELLVMNEFKLAKKVLKIKLRHLAFLELSFVKKMRFKLKLVLAYVSYSLIGRGYSLVKPLKE